jgi:hypothetical protein
VRRKVIAGTAAGLAALAIGVIAIGARGGSTPRDDRPLHAKPWQRYGDDADLMRRLERKKLTATTSR